MIKVYLKVTDNERTARLDPVDIILNIDSEGIVCEDNSGSEFSNDCFDDSNPIAKPCKRDDPSIPSYVQTGDTLQLVRSDATTFRSELADMLEDDESDSFHSAYEYVSGHNTDEDDDDNEVDEFGESYDDWVNGIRDGTIPTWLHIGSNDVRSYEASRLAGIIS